MGGGVAHRDKAGSSLIRLRAVLTGPSCEGCQCGGDGLQPLREAGQRVAVGIPAPARGCHKKGVDGAQAAFNLTGEVDECATYWRVGR
jgi:hypothetical protein